MMLIHYYAVEINLFNLCFSMPPTAPAHAPTLQRADVLFMCLSATQALVKSYLSIDWKPYINCSMVGLGQIYLALTTLSKLSLFDAEDWDVSNVQSPMNIHTLIDHMVVMMEETSSRYDRGHYNKQPWLQASHRMRQVRVQFDRLLSSENRSVPLPITQTREGPSFCLNNFDLLDDDFWQALPDVTTYI
jgi:hypothetical protein